ncbi:14229_t:CDS:2 [Dentiscutata erythropus]|uniref:Chitin synthase n=1 Tax=Dentiscutata erythropus TaxID=1348616 RepID=A0A9N9IHC1_9GLOM|nr:14229_t:CDS:2 [Dentiscutata erythropus]
MKLEKLLDVSTIEFITNKLDQQSLEYPDEEGNLRLLRWPVYIKSTLVHFNLYVVYSNPSKCRLFGVKPIFEHEISNILMKSIFGYISSLLEDSSAYWHSALQDNTSNTEDASNNSNILIANDYLAKNNTIYSELISKCNISWLLHYESLF